MLKPRGFSRPLGLFYFIHTLEVPVLSSYNEVINKNKEELHQLFFDLREKYGQTFVIVTHDEQLANITDRTIKMRDGLLDL